MNGDPDYKMKVLGVIILFVVFFTILPLLVVINKAFYIAGGLMITYFYFQTFGFGIKTFFMFATGLIVYFLVEAIINIYEQKATINAQWATYKCKPQYMPFAGWLVGPGSTNPAANFQDCMYTMNTSFFNSMISPVLNVIDTQNSIITELTNGMQDVTNMITYVRTEVATELQDAYNTIQKIYDFIKMLVVKFYNIFASLLDTFISIFEMSYFSMATLGNIIVGPIGDAVKVANDVSTAVSDVGNFFKKLF